MSKRNTYFSAWENLVRNGYPKPQDMTDNVTCASTITTTFSMTSSYPNKQRKHRDAPSLVTQPSVNLLAIEPSVDMPIPSNVTACVFLESPVVKPSSFDVTPHNKGSPAQPKQVEMGWSKSSSLPDLSTDTMMTPEKLVLALLQDLW